MFKIRYFFYLVILFLIIFSTEAKPSSKKKVKIPEWINQPYAEFSQKDYLVSCGEGKTRSEAELAAVESLASFFKTAVDSKKTAVSKIERLAEKDRSEYSDSSALSSEIVRNVSVKFIFGIEMKEFFEIDGKFYALAVLDRKKTCDTYEKLVERNNEVIKRLLSKSSDDEFSFENFSVLDYAGELALLNEEYLSRLAVLNPDEADRLKTYSSTVIELKKMEVAKQIPVHVKVDGDVDGRLEGAFKVMFGSMGFRTSDSVERYVFNAGFETKEYLTQDNTSVQCHYSFKGSLKDVGFEQSLLSYSFSGRTGSINYENALNLAVRNLEQKTKTEYLEQLNSFISELKSRW